MYTKLLPCPRCGNRKRNECLQGRKSLLASRLYNEENQIYWTCRCGKCFMTSGMDETKEAAIDTWNAFGRHGNDTQSDTQSGV